MALIILTAYIYSQIHIRRRVRKSSMRDRVWMGLFFSSLSILGTVLGIDVKHDELANTRPIGAITAGYIGGPLIGGAVGLIAGIQRLSLGGYTALACGVSTVLEGLIGGLVRNVSRNVRYQPLYAFAAGVLAEIAQMAVILALARPFSRALALEKIIALPMILINPLGAAVFVNILKNSVKSYHDIGAIHAQRALEIANQTLAYTSREITDDTAGRIARIICRMGSIDGAVLTDKSGVFAYYGEPVDLSRLRGCMDSFYASPGRRDFSIPGGRGGCTFFLSPIVVNGKTDGAIGMMLNPAQTLSGHFVEFCDELSHLLSVQIELYQLNQKVRVANASALKALRAQFYPHFIFNALNTIASFCRTDPPKARELLLNLAQYLRQILNKEDTVAVNEELAMLTAYLSIERARFGGRLQVDFAVPEDVRSVRIPSFILQPIVENSIKHGILKRASGGHIQVKADRGRDGIAFTVRDDGVGMSPKQVEEINRTWPGTGLRIVNERLKLMYNRPTGITVSSEEGKGTTVAFTIPLDTPA